MIRRGGSLLAAWARTARRDSRRRYEAAFAAVLPAGGGLLAHRLSGAAHTLGMAMFGYGLGVAVAAAFLTFGYDPQRRE